MLVVACGEASVAVDAGARHPLARFDCLRIEAGDVEARDPVALRLEHDAPCALIELRAGD